MDEDNGGVEKEGDKCVLEAVTSFATVNTAYESIKSFFCVCAALTGLTNRTLWISIWHHFIWYIQFQTERLSITDFFGNRCADINVTFCLFITFVGLCVNVKLSLLFSHISDMFNAFPKPTVSSLPSLQKWWLKVSLYFSFAFKYSTSFNSMCFPGIKEKHAKQQLNLSGIYWNWDLHNNWSSLSISQLRVINFFQFLN